MARRSCPATQAEIARLIKAAIAAGVVKEHIVVKLTRDGATMRFSERPVRENLIGGEDKSWDDFDAA